MEGAGSGAWREEEEQALSLPSLEPLPGEIHLCVHPWRRLGRFIYILVLQSQGMKRPGVALLWIGWKINTARLDSAPCMTGQAGSSFLSLSLCFPMECDVPWGSSLAGGDITLFSGWPSHSCPSLLSPWSSQGGGG